MLQVVHSFPRHLQQCVVDLIFSIIIKAKKCSHGSNYVLRDWTRKHGNELLQNLFDWFEIVIGDAQLAPQIALSPLYHQQYRFLGESRTAPHCGHVKGAFLPEGALRPILQQGGAGLEKRSPTIAVAADGAAGASAVAAVAVSSSPRSSGAASVLLKMPI